MQNITETICPQLCEGKLILQEIIQSLKPGRHCKQMTQALAQRAVEVTSHISPFLDGAEETQLCCNMLQLEQYSDFLLSTAHSSDGKAQDPPGYQLVRPIRNPTERVISHAVCKKPPSSQSFPRQAVERASQTVRGTHHCINFSCAWSYSVFFSKLSRRPLY